MKADKDCINIYWIKFKKNDFFLKRNIFLKN